MGWRALDRCLLPRHPVRAVRCAGLRSSPGGLGAQVHVGKRHHLKRRHPEPEFAARGPSPAAMMASGRSTGYDEGGTDVRA
jgi:hypothetical protein